LFLLRRYRCYTTTDPEVKAFYAPSGTAPATETLYGQTVGLVGYGVIARVFRKLLAPFGCRVLLSDPHLPVDGAGGGASESVHRLHTVLFTPHIAGPTTDELPELPRMAIADLERFLNGQPPLYPMTLEGYDLMSF